ncbi:MAG: transcription antitermination factor NusB, partial [Aeromonadales bacterium]|nr:transcription antitermination factor NusB [Aeromonadales bacterium]
MEQQDNQEQRRPRYSATPATRHKARHFALQALYQWAMTGDAASDIESQFEEDQPLGNADREYMHSLIEGVISHCEELDSTFEPFLSRPLKDLDVVDKAILRLGTYELKYRKDVPYRVVINESIMLAKDFAEQDSHKFV